MSDKLNALRDMYSGYLNGLGFTVSSNGAIGKMDSDMGVEPMVVDDKSVMFPVDDVLNNPPESAVIFHPICENILLGESPVIRELKLLTMEDIQNKIVDLITALLKISQDPEIIEGLTPTQVEWLKCTNGADATTLKNWQSLVRRLEVRGSSNRVVTIFTKRGTELNGIMYKRLAVVGFNLYEALEKDNVVYGVKFRKSDIATLKSIFQAIFEDIDETDAYTVGSNSAVAPYFHALAKAHANVVEATNSVAWRFRKWIEKSIGKNLHQDLNYMVSLETLDAYRDALPPLPYNDGDRKEKREQKVAEQQQVAPPVQPVPQQPVYQTAPPPPPVQPMQPIPQTPVYQQPVPQQPVQPQNKFPTLQEQIAQQQMQQQAYGFNTSWGAPPVPQMPAVPPFPVPGQPAMFQTTWGNVTQQTVPMQPVPPVYPGMPMPGYQPSMPVPQAPGFPFKI